MPKKKSNSKQLLLSDWEMTKKEKAKDGHLRRKYGINLKIYRQMLEDQGHMCAICEKKHEDERYGLVVDHNHRTGRVRGLLCNYCNRRVVGRIGDDRKRMKGFVKYIQKQLRMDKKWK